MAGTIDQVNPIPIEFPSSDGKSTLHGTIWLPADGAKPKGIVQIVHGMAEHHQRYAEFALELCRNGFAACAHDHVGHGQSAAPEDRGDMNAARGEAHLVEDVHLLRQLASQTLDDRYGEPLPYFIFGHSMGSLVLRVYLGRHGAGLTGAIICGTANNPFVVSEAGHILARLIAAVRGNDARSKLLHSLTEGAFAKAIDDAETPLDWLSVNKENVQAYMDDELAGAEFSAGGYATLTALSRDAVTKKTIKGIPKTLPLLLIAGEGDPVGAMGSGVRKAADALRNAGIKDVKLIIYPNMRHEILNEVENEQVYADVLTWLDAQLPSQE